MAARSYKTPDAYRRALTAVFKAKVPGENVTPYLRSFYFQRLTAAVERAAHREMGDFFSFTLVKKEFKRECDLADAARARTAQVLARSLCRVGITQRYDADRRDLASGRVEIGGTQYNRASVGREHSGGFGLQPVHAGRDGSDPHAPAQELAVYPDRILACSIHAHLVAKEYERTRNIASAQVFLSAAARAGRPSATSRPS